MSAKNHPPLTPQSFSILVSLADGDRHGYSIIKAVEAASGGRMRLQPGTLYRLIKHMLADGWIVEMPGTRGEDPRRRTYRLTPRGREIARAEASRLHELLRLARGARLLPA